jgi:hypothetical protein
VALLQQVHGFTSESVLNLSRRRTLQRETMMSIRTQDGTMMIREGLLLPDSAHIESFRYSNTWRTVPGLDSFALDRKLRAVGLHLFLLPMN